METESPRPAANPGQAATDADSPEGAEDVVEERAVTNTDAGDPSGEEGYVRSWLRETVLRW